MERQHTIRLLAGEGSFVAPSEYDERERKCARTKVARTKTVPIFCEVIRYLSTAFTLRTSRKTQMNSNMGS